MIEIWKSLKAAEAQAVALHNEAEKVWEAASKAKLSDATAPDPVHPSDAMPLLPSIRHAIGACESVMARAALADAKAVLAEKLKAAG